MSWLWANSAMGLKDLGELGALFIGALALLVSAMLGLLSWTTYKRSSKSASAVFGRGFIAVGALIVFAVGASLVLVSDLFGRQTRWVAPALAAGVLALMAIEFFVAASLYTQANASRPSAGTRALRALSYVFGGLFSLAACLLLLAMAIPGDGRDRGHVREVREYEKGCAKGNGSDCNMLGLRRQHGARGIPPDPKGAEAAFKKACDLGAAIGCTNVASMYSKGGGVPKDEALAKQYWDRSSELEATK